jgi:hypothetical protein
MRSLRRLPEKFFPDPLFSLRGKNGKRDDMSLRREDDVTPDPVLFATGGSGIDKKMFRVKGVEVDEGHPVVGGFREGFSFDFENGVQV